jgi:predicted RNA binding protein YcfA (HicA-like mRNA interferase family)
MATDTTPPKVLSQRSAIELLTAHGWKQTVGGKHSVKMERAGFRPITLPMHKGRDYGKALRGEILKQAGIT